ncbi:MAG: tail fiber domain-containing protein [Tenuifilaceae bacterium]
MFGVYQGGVRIYVEDSQIKGARGGFAVGGLTNQSKVQAEYFRITPDSARIYVKEPVTKGARGGFAVGGLTNQSKLTTQQFLNLTPDNYFIGHETGKSIKLGQYNIFIGYQAGANTTGYHEDMYPTDGDNNIFIGYRAGFSNTTGEQNMYLGAFSGEMNSNGESNTYVGAESGRNNTGYGNTLIGAQAGAYWQSNAGYKNTFIGSMCGWSNSSGNGNVFIGRECGTNNTSGYDNVFIGHLAGSNNSTGYGNVYIGSKAGWTYNGTNKLIIHNTDVVDEASSTLIFGDFSAKTLRFNANVGINVAPNSSKLYSFDNRTTTVDDPAVLGEHALNTTGWGIGVKGIGGYMGVYGVSSVTGTGSRYGVYGYAAGGSTNYAGYFAGNVTVTGTFTNSSDKNLKKNITPLNGALKKIMRLQGVTYDWKTESELSDVRNNSKSSKRDKEAINHFNFPKGSQIGVIAQDVEKVLPELVQTDEDGLKSVDYVKIVPVLIEAIKEQQKQIEKLTEEVEALKKNK